MAPAGLIDLSVRPTKVDRASDVTGLVDTGQLASLLSLDDTVAVMEAIQRISERKMQVLDPKQPWADPKQTTVTRNEVVQGTGELRLREGGGRRRPLRQPDQPQPGSRPGHRRRRAALHPRRIRRRREFRKTAAVMKMVLSGYAGAGTISSAATTTTARAARPASCATCAPAAAWAHASSTRRGAACR